MSVALIVVDVFVVDDVVMLAGGVFVVVVVVVVDETVSLLIVASSAFLPQAERPTTTASVANESWMVRDMVIPLDKMEV